MTGNGDNSEISHSDLWTALRDSIDRLASSGQSASSPQAIADRLAARARALRKRMVAVSTGVPTVFLGFHIGNQRFGIPVRHVIEVQALDFFSPVPRTPSFIRGVVHWRGAVLTLLDLNRLFDIPESGIVDLHVSLIVEAANKRIAVVALDVEDIYSVAAAEVKPPPALPGGVPPECVIGVHDNNRLIVNMDAVLQDSRLVLGGPAREPPRN